MNDDIRNHLIDIFKSSYLKAHLIRGTEDPVMFALQSARDLEAFIEKLDSGDLYSKYEGQE